MHVSCMIKCTRMIVEWWCMYLRRTRCDPVVHGGTEFNIACGPSSSNEVSSGNNPIV